MTTDDERTGKDTVKEVMWWAVQTGTLLALTIGGYFFSQLNETMHRFDRTLTEFRIEQAKSGERNAAQVEALKQRVDTLEKKCERLGK